MFSSEERPNSCPLCKRPLVGDPEKGEEVCPQCGIVLQERLVDARPEWKAIDLEEKEKRVRAGYPLTLTQHDYGLSTFIPTNDAEMSGVSAELRGDAYRLSKWQRRIRTTSPEDRSLMALLNRLNEAVEVLHLPGHVAETAAHIIRSAVKTRIAKSRSVSGIVGAAIYLACRKCNVSRMMEEISGPLQIDRNLLGYYYRYLVRMLEGSAVPLIPIENYIKKVTDKLGAGADVERLAIELAKRTKDSELADGKSPMGLAAAYVYLSLILLSKPVPQREVADVAGVTEVTLRNRYKELLQRYTLVQVLQSEEP